MYKFSLLFYDLCINYFRAMDILSLMKSYYDGQDSAGDEDRAAVVAYAEGVEGNTGGGGEEYSVSGGSRNGISVQVVVGGGGFLVAVLIMM
jgi:hypothetical protein